jgi:hypothetical protein
MLRSSTTPDGYYVDANGEWSLIATNSTADTAEEEAKQTSGSEDASVDDGNSGGFTLYEPQKNGGVTIDQNDVARIAQNGNINGMSQQTSDSEDTSGDDGNSDGFTLSKPNFSSGVWIDYEAAAQGMGKVNGL